MSKGGVNALKIYVGNLSYSSSEDDIRTAFSQFGTVDSVDVIIDRNSGRSKGFGFVEMSDAAEAKAAIEGLNGKDLDGRALNVNEARPRAERPQRSTYRY
jgi:RNA recognition motif-containing protein